MTPNELADLMIQFDSGRIWEHAQEIADTLRQQQVEIEALRSQLWDLKSEPWGFDRKAQEQ
jgi:hypothetical protein